MTTTVTKGKLIRSDVNIYDGINQDVNRKDSTGGTITGLPINDFVDVLQAYGNGEDFTYSTVNKCVSSIGSSRNRTLVFSPGTWVIDQNLTIGSNFTCRILAGAVFSVSSGKTLTFNGPVIRDSSTWTSGSGTVTESGTRDFTGTITFNGTVTYTGTLDLSSTVLQGASPLVFEGSTDDAFETTFAITDPTADRTITFPNSTGNIALDSTNNAFTGNNTHSGIETFDSGLGFGLIQNATLAVSVSGNAITIALKTKAGTDPSASDPVIITFLDSSQTTGLYVARKITSALSTTVSAGSTLGFSSSQTSRIYVAALDNSGTVELCFWSPLGAALDDYGLFTESQLNSTTAEGGAGGADSALTLYSTTARSNVRIRIIGHFDIQTGATAGNWSNSPSVVKVLGNLKTGSVVQVKTAQSSATASGTTTIPLDNTIPQITEGDQYLTTTFTPSSSQNILLFEVDGYFSNTAAVSIIGAIFKDSDADAIATCVEKAAATNDTVHLRLFYMKVAGHSNSATYQLRVGGSGAGTTRMNGASGAGYFNGTLFSSLRITEIFL